jgi:hypothetical protein
MRVYPPTVPGWYRDQDDPERIRYYDGERWTRRWRPYPEWASASIEIAAVDRPAARRRPRAGRQWGSILTVLGLVLLGVVLIGVAVASQLSSPSGQPDKSISATDAAFVSQASALCHRYLPARFTPGANQSSSSQPSSQPPNNSTSTTPAPWPKTGPARAARLAPLIQALELLPVKSIDRAEVDGWLGTWQDLINQLRAPTTSPSVAAAAQEAAANDVAELDAFSDSNSLDACNLAVGG